MYRFPPFVLFIVSVAGVVLLAAGVVAEITGFEQKFLYLVGFSLVAFRSMARDAVSAADSTRSKREQLARIEEQLAQKKAELDTLAEDIEAAVFEVQSRYAGLNPDQCLDLLRDIAAMPSTPAHSDTRTERRLTERRLDVE